MALIVVFLMYRFSAAMAAWLYVLHCGSARYFGALLVRVLFLVLVWYGSRGEARCPA
jgi:hypothetical protein